MYSVCVLYKCYVQMTYIFQRTVCIIVLILNSDWMKCVWSWLQFLYQYRWTGTLDALFDFQIICTYIYTYILYIAIQYCCCFLFSVQWLCIWISWKQKSWGGLLVYLVSQPDHLTRVSQSPIKTIKTNPSGQTGDQLTTSGWCELFQEGTVMLYTYRNLN